MAIKGILFDLYGTLIDIETDESMEEIYRGIAHFLTYQGIYLNRWEVRDLYYQIMRQQKGGSMEEFPEIDVEAIWKSFLKQQGIRSPYARIRLSKILAQMYRGISRKRLKLYPFVKDALDELVSSYKLGLVSDAQTCYALPEIRAVGLTDYFDPVIISVDYGFRKPDPRLFLKAMEKMSITPQEAVFVGNDIYRDIYGAGMVGMMTILFDSKQGTETSEDITPDYTVTGFSDVLSVLGAA